MNRIITKPENEAAWHALRAQDITSTESSALFGLSPYSTAFELWHRKKEGSIVQIEDNERMRWGRRLQDAIAYGIAEDTGWLCEPMKEYVRYPDLKMGASFDFRMINQENEIGIFEIKNVDYLVFRDKWLVNEDGSIEAPESIEIQLQHQLHVSGYEWGAIGVLVSGNSPKVLIRERDRDVGRAIEKRINAFWKSIEDNVPPPPTFPDDAEFVSRLYGYAQPGKVLDARGDAEIATLCEAYASASERAKLADEDKKTAKAQLLAKIGDHEKCLIEGYIISAGIVGAAEIAYTREPYRSFRLTAKKEKVAA
jgi:putative phage-type endonuclease